MPIRKGGHVQCPTQQEVVMRYDPNGTAITLDQYVSLRRHIQKYKRPSEVRVLLAELAKRYPDLDRAMHGLL